MLSEAPCCWVGLQVIFKTVINIAPCIVYVLLSMGFHRTRTSVDCYFYPLSVIFLILPEAWLLFCFTPINLIITAEHIFSVQLISCGASPLLMAGYRPVISPISKSSQHILIYNCNITTFDCQDNSYRADVFLPGYLPWHALVWRRLCSWSASIPLSQWCILHISLPVSTKFTNFPHTSAKCIHFHLYFGKINVLV